MQTAPQIRRITGVLRSDDCPAWIPHEEGITEDRALDAIIKHMESDSLRIDLLCSSGPVHWHEHYQCWMAWGNFTICSGGFEVLPLTDAGVERLTKAFEAHKQTEHYQLALRSEELTKLVSKKLESSKSPFSGDERMKAWKPHLAESKAIGERLEAIYKAKA